MTRAISIKEAVDALVVKHGGVRPAARAIQINYAYLSRAPLRREDESDRYGAPQARPAQDRRIRAYPANPHRVGVPRRNPGDEIVSEPQGNKSTENQTPWTRFMDMHSGGGRKLDWEYIYIEASEAEAQIIFQNRFGRNPNRVTCTCCGNDYSIDESKSLAEATAYERGCAWDGDGYVEKPSEKSYANPYRSLEDYVAHSGALFIRAADIKPQERVGELQEEGYVWR